MQRLSAAGAQFLESPLRQQASAQQGIGRTLLTWLRGFLPTRIPASRRERLIGSLGAGFGILIAAGLSQLTWGGPEPWFIAPMGAVAVLLFAMPASQLAQPWPTLAGNLIAATIGVSCAHLIQSPWLAAGCAVALTLGAMFTFHCLHPPAGGVALLAVMGGPAIQDMGYGFIFWPVGANVLLLLTAALIINGVTRRGYPNRPPGRANRHQTRDKSPLQRVGPNLQDLEQSLEEQARVLDISLNDLQELLQTAEILAHQRRLGDLTCGDVMSRDVVGVSPDSSVAEAWSRLAHHRFRALPVLHDDGALAGIVSLRDFLETAMTSTNSAPPAWSPDQKVRDIMTHKVQVAREDQPIAELVPILGGGGLHQVPVTTDGKVVGILSQADLVAALFSQSLRART